MAYASIAMTALVRTDAPEAVSRHAPDPIPALLIARLAVDQTVGGLGVGTALVGHILSTAAELNTKAACRAVIVNALSPETRSWWLRLGFAPLDASDDAGLDLYLLTSDIEATLTSL